MKKTICSCGLFIGGAIFATSNNFVDWINLGGLITSVIGLLLIILNYSSKKTINSENEENP